LNNVATGRGMPQIMIKSVIFDNPKSGFDNPEKDGHIFRDSVEKGRVCSLAPEFCFIIVVIKTNNY